jgi:hypothetical protein
MNATFPANANALPDRWINAIFERMAAMYGARFADLWRGTDMGKVRSLWAEKLAGFAYKPECLKAALEVLDDRPYPPNLPEFLGLCRETLRRSGSHAPALPHYPTPEEQERAQEMAEAARKVVRGQDRDHLAWARKPKSQMACAAVFDGAARDFRLARIRDDLIARGVADAAGKLLRTA